MASFPTAAYSVCAVNQSEEFRGENLRLVCDTSLWTHEKRSLTPAELRNKQAMWEFFSSASLESLQKALTIVDKTYVDLVIQLEKCLRSKSNSEGVFFDDNLTGAAPSRSAHPRRRSLPGRSGKFKKSDTGEYSCSQIFRSWSHILQLYPQLSESQCGYRDASESLRSSVRIADSGDKCDTLTLQPELLLDRPRLWTLLDDASLRCFATAMPPANSANPREKETAAETPWFSVVNVYSLGAFVANKLELALWREFRAATTGSEGKRVALVREPGSVPVATFPGAAKLMPSISSRSMFPKPDTTATVIPTTTTATTIAAPIEAVPKALPSPVPAVRTTITVDPVSGSAQVRLAPAVKPSEERKAEALLKSTLSRTASGLLSKAHLATFWDSLKLRERCNILLEAVDFSNGAITISPSGEIQLRAGAALGPGNSFHGALKSSQSLRSTALSAKNSECHSAEKGRGRVSLCRSEPATAFQSVSPARTPTRQRAGKSNAGFSPASDTAMRRAPATAVHVSATSAASSRSRDEPAELPASEGAALPSTVSVPGSCRVEAGTDRHSGTLEGVSSDPGRLRRMLVRTLSDVAGEQTGGGLPVWRAPHGTRSVTGDSFRGGSGVDEDYDDFDMPGDISGRPSVAESVDFEASHQGRPDLTVTPTIDQYLTMWPLRILTQDGMSVVQDIYLMSLQRVGTQEEETARAIGYRLQSKWAETNAMDLILAEEETKKVPSTPSGSRSEGKKMRERSSHLKARSASVTEESHDIETNHSSTSHKAFEKPPSISRQISSSSAELPQLTSSLANSITRGAASVGHVHEGEHGSWQEPGSRKTRRVGKGATAETASTGTSVSGQSKKSKKKKQTDAAPKTRRRSLSAENPGPLRAAEGTSAAWPSLRGVTASASSKSAPRADVEKDVKPTPKAANWSSFAQLQRETHAVKQPVGTSKQPSGHGRNRSSGSTSSLAAAALSATGGVDPAPVLAASAEGPLSMSPPVVTITSAAAAGTISTAKSVGDSAVATAEPSKVSPTNAASNPKRAEAGDLAPGAASKKEKSETASNTGTKESVKDNKVGGRRKKADKRDDKIDEKARHAAGMAPPTFPSPVPGAPVWWPTPMPGYAHVLPWMAAPGMGGLPAQPMMMGTVKGAPTMHAMAAGNAMGLWPGMKVPHVDLSSGKLHAAAGPSPAVMSFASIYPGAPGYGQQGPAGLFTAYGLAPFSQQAGSTAHPGPSREDPAPPSTDLHAYLKGADPAAISPDTGLPFWMEFQLHAELVKLQQWCTLHSQTRRRQELRAVWDIAKTVAEVVPAASLHIFGSFMTGLAIPQSDVDILIGGTLQPRHFSLLSQSIRNLGFVQNVVAVPSAHVPLIKVVATPLPPETCASPDVTDPIHGHLAPSPPVPALDKLEIHADASTHPVDPMPAHAPAEPTTPPKVGNSNSVGSFDTFVLDSSHPIERLVERSISPTESPRGSPSYDAERGDASHTTPTAVHTIKRATREDIDKSIQRYDALRRSPRVSPTSMSSLVQALSPASSMPRRGSVGTHHSAARFEGSDKHLEALNSDVTRPLPQGWFDSSAPIKLDITFDSSNHRGVTTTWYTRNQVAQVPALAPLVLALKELLQSSGLNDAYTGGMSSFGLLLLAQCFLLFNGRLNPQQQQQCRPHVFDQYLMMQQHPQPVGDGRPFAEFSAPYLTLPRELLANTRDVFRVPFVLKTPLANPHQPHKPKHRALHPTNRHLTFDYGELADVATRAEAKLDPKASFVPYPHPATEVAPSGTTHTNDSSAVPAGQNPYMTRSPELHAAAEHGANAEESGPKVPAGLRPQLVTNKTVSSGAASTEDEAGESSVSLLPPPILGKLFVKLLRYYGEDFTPQTTGLSVRYGGPFVMKTPNVVDPLTLPDPFDDNNNVGRNCFRFFQVQQVFREAHKALQEYGARHSYEDVMRQFSSEVGDGDITTHKEFPILSQVITALRVPAPAASGPAGGKVC